MRIVSLLPATTEILFAIGAGDEVVGVTFECDHPAEARNRSVVSTSALPEGLDPAGIDAFVAAAVSAGEDLYHLDQGALSGLDADLVVTQDLCAVCAVDVGAVDDALAHLGSTAEVLTVDPHTLEEVLGSVTALGRATGRVREAERLVEGLRGRLDAVGRRVAARASERERAGDLARPRLALLEWTDPAYSPGHWVPEMVELAGARSVLGRPGGRSERLTWAEVRQAAPDLVVCAPCGYELPAAVTLAESLLARELLPPDVPVWAVDANASFARPGPRLVDGVEQLEQVVAGETPDPDAVRRLR